MKTGLDRRPTVLVIDDERLVRQVVRRALEPDIAVVLEAVDGEEGLSLLDRDQTSIDLVVIDFKMPKIDGGTGHRRADSLPTRLADHRHDRAR